MSQHIIAGLLLLACLAYLSWYWWAPGGAADLRRWTGQRLPDLGMGMGPARLCRVLAGFDGRARADYRRLLRADLLFPPIYVAAVWVWADLLAPAGAGTMAAHSARAAVAAAALLDVAENLLLLSLLRRWPACSGPRAAAAGVATSLKFVALLCALAALLLPRLLCR